MIFRIGDPIKPTDKKYFINQTYTIKKIVYVYDIEQNHNYIDTDKIKYIDHFMIITNENIKYIDEYNISQKNSNKINLLYCKIDITTIRKKKIKKLMNV